MPLQRQVVSIPMSGGLNTKTDDKQLPVGQLLELENGFRKRNGELQKRYGFDSLGVTLDTTETISEGRRMAVYGDELNVITNKSMYTYSDENDSWFLKGPLETLSIDSNPIISNSYAQSTADSATTENVAIYAWEDSRVANQIRYSIVDRNSNSTIIGDALLDSNAIKPRCIALGTKLFVFYRANLNSGTAYNFKCKIFAAEQPLEAPITTTIGGDMNVSGIADIIVLNNSLLFAYQTSAPSMKIGYINVNGIVGNGLNGLPSPVSFTNALDNPELCITLFTDDADRFNVAWANTVATTGGVMHMGLFADLTTSWLARGQLDSYVGTATTRVRNITGFQKNTLAHIYWDKDDTSDKWKRSVTDTHRNIITGAITPGAGNLKSVSLAGKIFYTDDNGFVPVVYYSESQPTVFLLRNDGDIAAKMLSQRSAGETAKTGHLPNITDLGSNKFVFPTTYKTRLVSENAVTFGLTGVTEVIMNFDDEFIADSAQLGSNLLITSGYLQAYDGVSLFESGFHIYPDNITVTAGGGGVIPNNEYVRYSVVYEWTDAKGQVHRSAPSIPIQKQAASPSTSFTLTIPTLHITDRTGARGEVVIAIYRTEANLIPQQIFYKLTSVTAPLYNNTAVLQVTFTDNTITNEQLRLKEILYTSGGVVENIAPPAAKIIARFKNRLILAGLEDKNTLWYSQQHIPGEAVNFSDVFKIQVDDTGGQITALGELDDKLIIFKAGTIFAMNGDGPLPTGAQNTFSLPQLVSSDVGCVDPYSVVRTRVGLMFKSSKGIYLLDRSLQVSYVGAEVERWNDLTITAATVVEDQNQVRFTTSEGRCLVYDLYFQQWYTFTNIRAIDCKTWQGKFVFLQSSAEIWRENQSSYIDVDVPVISKYVLALLQFAQVQGFQRIYKINILGENRGTHGLKIEIGYDFREFYEERFLIEPDDVLVGEVWGEDSVWGEAGTIWGGELDGVYQFQIRPRQQRCQALRLKIEDYFGSGTGSAGFALSNVAAEMGVEPNAARLAKTKIIAP